MLEAFSGRISNRICVLVSVCSADRGRLRRHDFQLVVSGKVHDELPSHGLGFSQVRVDDDAFHTVNRIGNTPRGIAEVTAHLGTPRAELAHDAGQTLGPIARSKGFAIQANAMDKDFLG